MSSHRLLLALVAVVLIFALAWPLFTASTPPITDGGGEPIPGSIATLERVRLGGLDQWILIRGENRDAPILLWLHGGPGAAQMSVARHYNGALEAHFVVVHWDQRGAGKSNPWGFDDSTMRFERFIADARALTEHLKARFERDAILLLGHSWGTQLGAMLARDHPEHYLAYIAVAQAVGGARSQPIAYRWLREHIAESGTEAHRARLEALGEPPYREHEDYVAFAGLLDEHGGNMDLPFRELLTVALRAPEYTPLDYLRWLRGARRGSGPMWNEPDYAGFDAFEDVPRLEPPVYFITGANDYNTPAELAARYCEALVAPAGKRLIVFEDSAHTPFFAEPERFHETLRRIKREVTTQAAPPVESPERDDERCALPAPSPG